MIRLKLKWDHVTPFPQKPSVAIERLTRSFLTALIYRIINFLNSEQQKND